MTHRQIASCTVITASGTTLGKVTDMVYDVDAYTVVQFVVTTGLLKTHEYRIHPHQILSITEKEITVEDTVVPLRGSEDTAIPTGASPAMMRETE